MMIGDINVCSGKKQCRSGRDERGLDGKGCNSLAKAAFAGPAILTGSALALGIAVFLGGLTFQWYSSLQGASSADVEAPRDKASTGLESAEEDATTLVETHKAEVGVGEEAARTSETVGVEAAETDDWTDVDKTVDAIIMRTIRGEPLDMTLAGSGYDLLHNTRGGLRQLCSTAYATLETPEQRHALAMMVGEQELKSRVR